MPKLWKPVRSSGRREDITLEFTPFQPISPDSRHIRSSGSGP
jgi:hypothetical protein